MQVNGKLTIDCNRCGKSYDFTSEDVSFIKEGEKYVWEKKYNCVKCGNPISIRYVVSLSDNGAVKGKQVQIDGAKVVNDSFEFKM